MDAASLRRSSVSGCSSVITAHDITSCVAWITYRLFYSILNEYLMRLIVCFITRKLASFHLCRTGCQAAMMESVCCYALEPGTQALFCCSVTISANCYCSYTLLLINIYERALLPTRISGYFTYLRLEQGLSSNLLATVRTTRRIVPEALASSIRSILSLCYSI